MGVSIMTKTELLALADEKPNSINDDLYAWATQAAAALREFAGMMDAGPEPIISMKRNEFDSLSLGAKSVLGTLIGGMKAPYRDELKSISRDDPRHPLYTHPPTPTTGEPVAWLSAYVNSEGLPDQYVTTHHELAVENDANRSPKPLFFNPPAPTTQAPVAWMNVKYGTFFGAGVIAATDRNDDLIASGELVRLYTHPPAPTTGEPVAWLYTCQKPGTQTVYASVDEYDSYHWPIDQWKSFVKTPLFAHPPALTTQKVCHGIPRIGCNYLAECDSICNKCGQLHAVQFIPPAPTTQEPVAWLAAYVNSEGLPDQYVTTHHELAVENDANRSPKPLFFNPPAPTTQAPVA